MRPPGLGYFRPTVHPADGLRFANRVGARVAGSLLRDARLLALHQIAPSDRLRLTYEKYASGARAMLGLPSKAAFQFAGRPYYFSAATDAGLLQRVLVDTHECLALFGLVGEANLTAVDIGAHNGETAIAWSIFLRDPTIYSFEPDPVAGHNAQRNIGGIASALHTVGLSDKTGDAPFDTQRGSGGDATFALDGDGEGPFTAVPVARGDELLAGIAPDLIKIDVEGYERHVVDGLSVTLAHCRFLTIEMSLQRPKDHRFHEIASVLSNHRFELIGAGQPHGADPSRRTAIDLHFRR